MTRAVQAATAPGPPARPVDPPPVDRRNLTAQQPVVKALVGVTTAAATLAVVVAHRSNPLVASQLAVVVSVLGLLSTIDLAEQRLPNRITLPLAGTSALAIIAGGIGRADLASSVLAVGLGLLFAIVFIVLRFGMGDAKLALTVGMIAGWFGLDAVMATAYAAAGAGALAAAILMIVHRRRDVTFPFGPILAIGAIAGMLVGA